MTQHDRTPSKQDWDHQNRNGTPSEPDRDTIRKGRGHQYRRDAIRTGTGAASEHERDLILDQSMIDYQNQIKHQKRTGTDTITERGNQQSMSGISSKHDWGTVRTRAGHRQNRTLKPWQVEET